LPFLFLLNANVVAAMGPQGRRRLVAVLLREQRSLPAKRRR
jgi:hypothetical protein